MLYFEIEISQTQGQNKSHCQDIHYLGREESSNLKGGAYFVYQLLAWKWHYLKLQHKNSKALKKTTFFTISIKEMRHKPVGF